MHVYVLWLWHRLGSLYLCKWNLCMYAHLLLARKAQQHTPKSATSQHAATPCCSTHTGACDFPAVPQVAPEFVGTTANSRECSYLVLVYLTQRLRGRWKIWNDVEGECMRACASKMVSQVWARERERKRGRERQEHQSLAVCESARQRESNGLRATAGEGRRAYACKL